MIELNQIINEDCLEVLKDMDDNSVDSIVTDPPYMIGFMGKEFDKPKENIAGDKRLWGQCLRVLKPGGHLLSFGGSRTYHRMVVAIEDAGFEIRDQIMWVYGEGFPKSRNIGRDVDKIQGNERENLGLSKDSANRKKGGTFVSENEGQRKITKGNSKWEGWHTGLKPAHEPICLARKPISEKNIAKNVLKWGTGGLNIGGCRIPCQQKAQPHKLRRSGTLAGGARGGSQEKRERDKNPSSRFPANLIHDGSDEVVELFPNTHGAGNKRDMNKNHNYNASSYKISSSKNPNYHKNNGGSAARFFYCAKASKKERNAGLEGMRDRKAPRLKKESRFCKKCGKREDYGCGCNAGFTYKEQPNYSKTTKNHHPTVKPLALMQYLCRLITPPEGIVLDPFTGSGSTCIAAKKEGFHYIGIEKDEEYCEIARARIKGQNKGQRDLFEGTE